jgi:2,4-dichlorophenol 6-monooxygenase
MTSQKELPVLIVGAGPVGLLASILLSQQGISSRVVERRGGPQTAPAAHVVNARTLEICRSAGLDMQAIGALAKDPRDAGQTLWMTRLAGEEIGRLPFERQGDECLEFTPTPLRNLSQHRLEPLLVEGLRKSPGARLDYGQQWESSQQDADGVTSRIRDVASDTVSELRSRWLLAADGAGSRVRKSLGIEALGPQRLQSFVMVHFAANLRPLVKDRPGVLYWICDPECGGTFVAHDIDREWVFMHPWDPERESESAYDEDACAELVRRALGTRDVGFEIRGISTWTMTAQVAERLRADRIFLVGDAAHRFPPTGGLGLNTGAQDVHNLAWKLRAVEEDWAPLELLESYESERRPVAQENADQSLRNAFKLIEVPQALGVVEEPTRARMEAVLADPAARERVQAAIANQAEHFDMLGLQLGFSYESGAVVPDGTPRPLAANPVREYVPTSRPGSRLPHAWVSRDGERVSSLDLVAPDAFTLFTGPEGAAWLDAADAQAIPVRCVVVGDGIADPEGHWARVREIDPDGALLVRPDQHVAWRAASLPSQPDAALAAALREVLKR